MRTVITRDVAKMTWYFVDFTDAGVGLARRNFLGRCVFCTHGRGREIGSDSAKFRTLGRKRSCCKHFSVLAAALNSDFRISSQLFAGVNSN